jgi:hypothetical protein
MHAMNQPINPLRLAEKIHRLKRMCEMLWFIQWQSLQPGGLGSFVETLIENYPAPFGPYTNEGHSLAEWSLEECMGTWERLRCDHGHDYSNGLNEFLHWALDKDFDARIGCEIRARNQRLMEGTRLFNRRYFARAFYLSALSKLPGLLVDLCERPGSDLLAPSYFPNLYEALCGMMDLHAASARKSIASTRVVDMVFKRLDFGLASQVPTLILGDARIGKTKSVSTWASMHPGRARVVTVPSDDTLTAFYYAHADALGLDYSPSTSIKALKFDLEFIIANSGLLYLYDESHFLVPQNYTAKTPPQRMNWVRSRVIDLGLGVAFFSTRQSYQSSMRKYGKKTQYQFEQWLGRIAPPLILPADLETSELLAAARAMFPKVDEDLLALVVERCAARNTGLQEIGGAVQYALFLASRAGREMPDLEDVDGAFSEFLGEGELPAAPALQAREMVAPLVPPNRATQPISGRDQHLTTDSRREVTPV